MNSDKEIDAELFQEIVELKRLGNKAVHRAQAENRKKGIPNAYSHRGTPYFELPDGTLTLDDPFETEDRP